MGILGIKSTTLHLNCHGVLELAFEWDDRINHHQHTRTCKPSLTMTPHQNLARSRLPAIKGRLRIRRIFHKRPAVNGKHLKLFGAKLTVYLYDIHLLCYLWNRRLRFVEWFWSRSPGCPLVRNPQVNKGPVGRLHNQDNAPRRFRIDASGSVRGRLWQSSERKLFSNKHS